MVRFHTHPPMAIENDHASSHGFDFIGDREKTDGKWFLIKHFLGVLLSTGFDFKAAWISAEMMWATSPTSFYS